jgi:putative transposase
MEQENAARYGIASRGACTCDYPLSLRNVEEFLAEREIDVRYENGSLLVEPLWPDIRAEIRKMRFAPFSGYTRWRWFLDEVFVKVNGKLCYLWRAVDHEGEGLDAVVTAKRDNAAALRLLKRIMKRYGPPHEIVIDGIHGLLRCDEGDRSR